MERRRPPAVADERTQLTGWLDLQRGIAALKCEGLSDEDAHRSLVPTSPLMTVAGVVAHLRWTEHCWFQVVHSHREEDLNPQFGDGGEGADFRTAHGVPLLRLLEEYERECAASRAVVAAASLDDLGRHPRWGGASLRWVLQHMLEETARHVGHLDLLREQLDGRTGYM
ncbi:DinB family protein [Vallicoccus soli]|uniref:DinB family protein n=1 Tax=Vallicoccus soli TaxID=2339232 RepID=A0A3A3YWA9_9ACTN|nr:DinB family protein [Vallicoccus soli]RJK94967.1 DinB family protein [Vallicoccus soli]